MTAAFQLGPSDVLYEDNHLLVIDKPAGIATMGAEAGDHTIARMAATYLKKKYNKPGNVFIGVVSRIDRLVSGVLVLARTSKCAARLSEQFRQREPQKRYIAIVDGRVDLSTATNGWLNLTDHVRKKESEQRMEVVPGDWKGAQTAQLRLRCMGTWRSQSLIEVELLTGRKHQIRLQLSALGHPILGDRKYGSTRKFSPGIALHSYSLSLKHPTRDESLRFISEPTRHWQEIHVEVRQALDVFTEQCRLEEPSTVQPTPKNDTVGNGP